MRLCERGRILKPTGMWPSDNLNKNIEALNKRLAEMNIGLEVWLESDYRPLAVDNPRRPIRTSGLQYDSSVSPPRKYEESVYLGYCRVKNAWELAIKYEETTYEWDQDSREEYQVSESTLVPLLKASREIRLLAVERFDDLLSLLNSIVQQKVETAKRAEKLANPQE